MSGGLLVGGLVIPVPGVTVANPLDTPWAKLDARDYRRRNTSWVRQAIVHTTKGIWPQRLIPTAPGGKAKVVADFYRRDPEHNGAQAVADLDGTGACLADLATQAAHHAGLSNEYSWGLEIYQLADGTLTEASIRAAIEMLVVGCDALGIPLQVHRAPYRNGRVIERLKDGGRNVVGVFGHRDQAWDAKTQRARRGRGDPGDLVMDAVAADPRFEAFDFHAEEDLRAWERRQCYLRRLGHELHDDGVAGPATMRAMRLAGFASGREIDAALELSPAAQSGRRGHPACG